ncbi:SRPBCC family protein [uncultured Thiothrix sp.]|uniref:SRPBCC family protein n=1 Tax=uncultured Thiothrix sp. TaxID=223185 RepID=UPI00260C21C4|nr:SRPBCC family protein [uncultured Thiothrix sp.]
MANLEIHTEIHAPLQQVYAISQDYSQRYEWDPFPESIQFLQGATEVAVGSQVYVLAKSGLKMVVEFIQVKPPEVTAIKMIQGPLILKAFAGSWIFKALPNGNTKAVFKYTIQAKSWLLPALSNKIIIWYFARHVRLRLDGLKRYCELCVG